VGGIPFFVDYSFSGGAEMNDPKQVETVKGEDQRTAMTGAEHVAASIESSADECAALREEVCRLRADATQNQARLAELQQGEAKYRELVEESCSVVLCMDSEGNVTYANRHALSFFGFGQDELLGKHVVGTIVPLVERSGRDLAELIHDICEHPERYQDNENENVQQDGTRRWMAWTNKGIRDASGRPKEIVCIGNDITDRKEVEEVLRSEQARLRHLLEWQQYELNLVAYEIHDGLAQLLTAAAMQLQAFDAMEDDDGAKKAHRLGRDLLDRAIVETRRLISDLRPPVLEESGIVSAIQELIRQRDSNTPPKVEFVCDTRFTRLDPLLENGLFRMVQEALNNAARHSRSDRVRITLRQRSGRIRLSVRDWGNGFELSSVGDNRFGLEGIRERARILGGEAKIKSTPGQGTLVRVRLPLISARQTT